MTLSTLERVTSLSKSLRTYMKIRNDYIKDDVDSDIQEVITQIEQETRKKIMINGIRIII